MSAQPLHAVPDSPGERHDPALLQQTLGYFALVRDAFRMQNWDITIHQDPIPADDENGDAWAETWQSHNHAMINVRLSKCFWDQTPEAIRNTVVHELIHAQHRDVSILWEACTIKNSNIPASESQSWNHDMSMFIERFVSWITQRTEITVPPFDFDREYPVPEGCTIFDGVHPR